MATKILHVSGQPLYFFQVAWPLMYFSSFGVQTNLGWPWHRTGWHLYGNRGHQVRVLRWQRDARKPKKSYTVLYVVAWGSSCVWPAPAPSGRMQRTEGGVPPAAAPTVQHPTPTVADAAPGTEARRLVWLSGRCACVRPSCGCHGFEVRVIHPNETWHLVLSMCPYFAFRQPWLSSCERSLDNLLTAQAISSAQRWRRGVDSPDWAWATLLSIDLLARGSSQSSWRRRQLPLRPKHRTETGETHRATPWYSTAYGYWRCPRGTQLSRSNLTAHANLGGTRHLTLQ
jgi:hypothetical protein